ncbi:TetR/AcrR family transcriptional regulator [Lentzea sp. BCCO 10_0856]|uniref:TetR/AcrR family transcriptional regulator n=1 Tax=Lentzea miocenica TaxID=3095431 RepID=A0ABU4TAV8_9PSEU|nr:TetR/AcrR family transcriptional regulator [Lentzea sp. BCCO 10_0856]MDX8035310.1 TetR/AcrR family transcriptional regulator [Lentzea sp. BCCO 10_0856]
MVRLTRVQQQERTRASVLAAAKEEFTEHGYAAAKIDRIAERAELTRGAVYSNFPSKRALYLAVLIDLVEGTSADGSPEPASMEEALGAFARAWLERLPLAGETASGGRLQLRSLTGVFDDDHGRAVLAQLAGLEAFLLGAALEGGTSERRVRLASLVLTLLGGAGQLADTAPGSGDPFDLVLACQHLAGLGLADAWAPPYLAFVKPARPCRESWVAPADLVDLVGGEPVDLAVDGLVAVLGAGRLGAAEEAFRAARAGEQVTVVVVVSDAAEIGRLVRLRIADLMGCLRRVLPLPSLRIVLDDDAAVATALGLDDAGDETEAAMRVQGGAIVARAHGRGAAHAAAGS